MSRVIEPLMIVMVAAIIAPIIIASYLPLFELIGQLAGK
jgi:type II secretory pathway component PulF